MATETSLMISVQIPRKLHTRLKLEAVKAGVSLKEFVALWLEYGTRGCLSTKAKPPKR